MERKITNEELYSQIKVVIEQNNEIISLHDEQKAKVDEMYEIFSGLMTSKKWMDTIVKYLFAILIGVGSLYLMLKQIIK